MSAILILCPTFDHTETLFASVASVRAQKFRDWEMVVIGDGAPGRTAEIMAEIAAIDSRVRYEPHPKSARFGELYRDRVIRESKADVVLQLGDDDLWAPDHIDCMLDLLRGADWANQAPLRVAPDGSAEWRPVNHGTAHMCSSIVRGVPVSAGPNFVAYRREVYLRLPEGWTCAPAPGPSDAYTWGKFFRNSGLAVASTAASTAIKFPSHVPGRAGIDSSRRLSELQPWLGRIAEPGFVRRVCAEASVRSRFSSLYKIHAAAGAGSWREALQQCGFEPVPADGSFRPAYNGDPMLLPLTSRQMEEAEVALQDGQGLRVDVPAAIS